MMRRRDRSRCSDGCSGRRLALGAAASPAARGQPAPDPPAKPFAGPKLVVGVVGEPAILPSIRAQRGEWAARTGAELSILDEPVNPKAGEVGRRRPGLPRRPDGRPRQRQGPGGPARLGRDPARADRRRGDARPEPPPDDLEVQGHRPRLPRPGRPIRARPDGPADRRLGPGRRLPPIGLRQSANKEAAKAAGLTLEPPKTWEQFDALARFFHGRDWDGDGSPESGVALAWAADPEGVGDATLLARAAALGLHPDQFSFLLDSETTGPGSPPPRSSRPWAFAALKASARPAPRSSMPTPRARRSDRARSPC